MKIKKILELCDRGSTEIFILEELLNLYFVRHIVHDEKLFFWECVMRYHVYYMIKPGKMLLYSTMSRNAKKCVTNETLLKGSQYFFYCNAFLSPTHGMEFSVNKKANKTLMQITFWLLFTILVH